MSNKTILVSGGAGYIGSHVVKQLIREGRKVVILDNLSTGFAQSVQGVELVVGDTGDTTLVRKLLQDHNIGAVMHFAAHTIVPESVSDPLKYYKNNTCSSRNLLNCCADQGIEHFIFSSTAAVYGLPVGGLAREDTPLNQINPYGTSKLMTEWMLRDLSAVSPLRHVVLRYFNVAGCDIEGQIGQSTRNATLLTKVACEAAVGKREKVLIFGTDYPTPDGTGVRDYIHVEDLADAHLRALDYLEQGGSSSIFNCGYGHGYSVREVLKMVEKVNGAPLKIEEMPRRAGDPPSLIADASRIRTTLGWIPKHDNLETIVTTALNWERKLLEHDFRD